MEQERKVTIEQIADFWKDIKEGKTVLRNDLSMLDASYSLFDSMIDSLVNQERRDGIKKASRDSILRSIPTEDGKGISEKDVKTQRTQDFVEFGRKAADGAKKYIQSDQSFHGVSYLNVISRIQECQKYSGLSKHDFYQQIGVSEKDQEGMRLQIEKKFIKDSMGILQGDGYYGSTYENIKSALETAKRRGVEPSQLFEGSGYKYEQYQEMAKNQDLLDASKAISRAIKGGEWAQVDYFDIEIAHARTGLGIDDFMGKLKNKLKESPELQAKEDVVDKVMKKIREDYEYRLAHNDLPLQHKLAAPVAPVAAPVAPVAAPVAP